MKKGIGKESIVKSHAGFMRFTMIELMVVISIIAILASLLLPALRTAKESARTIACNSQLKQFGCANTMYAVDNMDWLPFSQVNYQLWDYLLMPYVSYVAADADKIKRYSVFHCPGAGDYCVFNVSRYRYKSYAYNFNFTTNSGRRLSTLSNASRYGLMCDASYGAGLNYSNGITMCAAANLAFVDGYGYMGSISYRHIGKVNVLFADSHASSLGKGIYETAYGNWRPLDVSW